MTETEIGTMLNDFMEHINKMNEQHETEMKRVMSELKMANEQIAMIDFEKRKENWISALSDSRGHEGGLKNPNHIRNLGLKVKVALETEYDGTTFKKQNTVHCFAEFKPAYEHLAQGDFQ